MHVGGQVLNYNEYINKNIIFILLLLLFLSHTLLYPIVCLRQNPSHEEVISLPFIFVAGQRGYLSTASLGMELIMKYFSNHLFSNLFI